MVGRGPWIPNPAIVVRRGTRPEVRRAIADALGSQFALTRNDSTLKRALSELADDERLLDRASERGPAGGFKLADPVNAR